MPWMSLLLRILMHKISKTIINKQAERGSPCLTPSEGLGRKTIIKDENRDVIIKRMDPLYK